VFSQGRDWPLLPRSADRATTNENALRSADSDFTQEALPANIYRP